MEIKLLGMPRHIAIGLSWFFWPLGIVVLAVERTKLTHLEKNQLISNFIISAVGYIASFLVLHMIGFIFDTIEVMFLAHMFYIFQYIVEIALAVLIIFCMVKAFMNQYFTVPVVTTFADKFIDDKYCATSTEEVKEEAKEETVEESNEENK